MKMLSFSIVMIIYVDNPKESIDKLLELINGFRNICDIVNVQKSEVFLYIGKQFFKTKLIFFIIKISF